jgi:hypothetical protein
MQRTLNNVSVDEAFLRRYHSFRRELRLLESTPEENPPHASVNAEPDDFDMHPPLEDEGIISASSVSAPSAQHLAADVQTSAEISLPPHFQMHEVATVSESYTNFTEQDGNGNPVTSESLAAVGREADLAVRPPDAPCPPQQYAHLPSIFAQLDEVQCLFQSKLNQQELLTIVTRFSAIKSDLISLFGPPVHAAARATPSEILAHPSQPSTKTKKRRKPQNKNAAAAATPAVVSSVSASESPTLASSKAPTAQTELTSRGPDAASQPPHDTQQPHPQSYLDVARRSTSQPVAPPPQPTKPTPRSGVLVFRNADDQKKSISQIRDIMQQLNFKQGRDFTWVNSHGATFSLWGVHKTSIPRLKSVLATATSEISLITNFDLRDKAQHTTRELSNKFKALYTDSLASRLQNDALLDLIRRRQKTSLEYLRNSSRNRNGALNQLVQLWQEAISELTPSAAGASSAVATHA